jgi:hypothetical protein
VANGLFDVPRQVRAWRKRLASRGVELENRATDLWIFRCRRCDYTWQDRRRLGVGRPPKGYGLCPNCTPCPEEQWTTVAVRRSTADAVSELAELLSAERGGRCTRYEALALAVHEALSRRRPPQ